MLQILIIDDADRKITRIKNVISEFDEIQSDTIAIARTQVDAKRLISKIQFDLIILDIYLPNREGDTPKADGGIALLREIHSRTRYQKPHYIVGLTAYPEEIKRAGIEFGEYLWSIFLYEDNTDQWEDRLRHSIEYLIELRQCESLKKIFKYDLAIITALVEPEFEAVRRLTDWEDVNGLTDDTRYFTGHFEAKGKKIKTVAACLPQMGMPAAAVVTTKMISHFCPRFFAMVGITAGVRGQVALGDVVVADPCWDWGSGKLVHEEGCDVLEPDPLQHRLDSSIRALFLDAQRDKELLHRIWKDWPSHKPKQPPTLHVGPCVSGACVLTNANLVKTICEHNRKLVGIDMEAYGLMHAGAHSVLPHPITFSMKGVSDFADEQKNDSYKQYASYVSASLLQAIANKYL